MKFEVPCCAGGEGFNLRATSFLINDSLLIDAGAVANATTLEQQNRIRHALITHAHLDHIKDLGFVADNTFATRSYPLQVISTASVIEALRSHYFNWLIWPDFSQLPSPDKAALEFISREDAIRLDGLHIEFIPVNHPGGASGFMIEELSNNCSILVTGDTGNTEQIWQRAKKRNNLKAIFADTAFPENQQHIVELSGHMTPSLLNKKLTDYGLLDMDVYCYHLKPAYHEQVVEEIKGIGLSTFRPLRQSQVLQF